MNIGVVVQARMNSRRCPGKVLRRLGKSTVLGQLLGNLSVLCDETHLGSFSRSHCEQTPGSSLSQDARLSNSGRLALCVATSVERSDDPIADFCAEHSTVCHRGSLDHVSHRMLSAAESLELDGFVRVSGDSPFLDYRLVERAVTEFRFGNYDLVTNVFPRSFPKGQSVEVVRTSRYASAVRRFQTAAHHEHVTAYYYDRPSEFRIHNFEAPSDCSDCQLAIDTEEDYANATALIARLTKPVQDHSWGDFARDPIAPQTQSWRVAG